MKKPQLLIWPGVILAVILGMIPIILTISYGVPFHLSTEPITVRITIGTVWLGWLSISVIFFMELAAALRGKSMPLILPTIQRPMARIITDSFVFGLSGAQAVNFKRPLMAIDTPLHTNGVLANPMPMNGSTAPPRRPMRHRLILAKVISAALASLDTKLRNRDIPQILGVGIEAHLVRVMLDGTAVPPEGFKSASDGQVWEISISGINNLPEPKPGELALPLFAPLGYYSGGSIFYLNLETANCLAIHGDHSDLPDFLAEICRGMVSDDLDSRLRVFCVGFGYDLVDNSQIMAVDRLGDILPAIEKQACKVRHPSMQGNISTRGYLPILVIDPFTDNRELTDRLEKSVGRGVSAILGYGVGDWSLEVTNQEVNLSPLGLQLSRFPSQAILSEPESQESDSQKPSPEKQELVLPEAEPPPEPEPSAPIRIKVLGAVRAENSKEIFSSLQSLSLVTYLAINRKGVSSDQLMRWIWPPDDPPTRQIFANVVSRARRSLGNSPEEAYIVYESGIYRLSSDIKTDLEDFQAGLKAASEQDDESKEMEFLSKALSMVDGVPFTVGDSRSFLWADNGVRGEVECSIDTAVHRLADLAIKQGEFSVARQAITQGLMCIPGCEQCFARLLIASAKSQNCGALIKVKLEMETAYKSLGYEIPKGLTYLYEDLYEQIKDSDLVM